MCNIYNLATAQRFYLGELQHNHLLRTSSRQKGALSGKVFEKLNGFGTWRKRRSRIFHRRILYFVLSLKREENVFSTPRSKKSILSPLEQFERNAMLLCHTPHIDECIAHSP